MALSPLGLVDRIPSEIKRRRLMLGMSQTSLAHAVGCNIHSVHKWENGVNPPSLRILPKLAKALHVTEMELLYPSDDEYPESKLNEKVVQEIKRLRLSRKITQEEFAEKVGVTWSTVARWETGEVAPAIKYLPKFAEILGVSEQDLLNPSPDAEAPKKYARVEGRQGRKKKIMT